MWQNPRKRRLQPPNPPDRQRPHRRGGEGDGGGGKVSSGDESSRLISNIDLGLEFDLELGQVIATTCSKLGVDPESIPNDVVGEAFNIAVKESARHVFRSQLRHARKLFKIRNREEAPFLRRLRRHWGGAFDALRFHWDLCYQVGEMFNTERRLPNDAVSLKIEVLTRMQARSCQVLAEVVALIEGGYAAGAHARWRTLHELNVIARVIAAASDSVCRAFWEHEVIALGRDAKIFLNSGFALSDKERSDAQAAVAEADCLKVERGSDFMSDWGWAKEFVKKRKPTFKELEESVGMQGMRLSYGLSNHAIHVTARSLFITIADCRENPDAFVAGRSNMGFDHSAGPASHAVSDITECLLMQSLSFYRGVSVRMLRTSSRLVEMRFRVAANEQLALARQ